MRRLAPLLVLLLAACSTWTGPVVPVQPPPPVVPAPPPVVPPVTPPTAPSDVDAALAAVPIGASEGVVRALFTTAPVVVDAAATGGPRELRWYFEAWMVYVRFGADGLSASKGKVAVERAP